jgi:hypothetical protein
LNRTAGCPDGQFCRVALTTPSGDGVGAALCDRCDQCDLLGATGCPMKQACYAIEAACTACLPEGRKAVGEACRHANECASGSTCARLAESDQRCVRFCARDDGAECTSDERCVAVAAMALPEGVGACVR